MFFTVLFAVAEKKYALKVKTVYTARVKKISATFVFFQAVFCFLILELSYFLVQVIDSELYTLFGYLPLTLTCLFAPISVALANAVVGVFENARNKKFVRKQAKVLDETDIIRVGVVGSFAKTNIKNILKTILSVKYSVIETPKSFNTPMGIALTVDDGKFKNKQVFIAEMGARQKGDIKELCDIVKPNYTVFTGICNQHIETFLSLDGVYNAKKECIFGTEKLVVCGKTLQEKISADTELDETQKNKCVFVENISEEKYYADKTEFDFTVKGESFRAETVLLGKGAVENISLCIRLAEEMGLSGKEIQKGIKNLKPVPHRLERKTENGVTILDDSYNSNETGASYAVEVLKLQTGKKFVVTPGIVEGGTLEDTINRKLGELLVGLDKVILVGDTLVSVVKTGYLKAGGDGEKTVVVSTLDKAQKILEKELNEGDAVLFLNDLPDVY